MRFSSYLFLVCISAGALLSACGEEGDPVVAQAPGATSGTADGGIAGAGCTAGQSEGCTCLTPGGTGPVPGTRSCVGGAWQSCSCAAPTSPTTVVEECLAGRYEGNFSGFYSSGFAGGAPIPVVALDLTGRPGLAFTLLRSDSGDDEFATYTISDGYLEGNADGLFPIKGVITGTLDCKTRRFTGTLKGSYSILLPLGLNEGQFEGPVTGEYDVTTHTFKLGTWKVMEGEDVVTDFLSDAGGEGDWDAMFVGP